MNMNNHYAVAIAGAMLAIILLAIHIPCQSAVVKPISINGFTMGTTYRIQLSGLPGKLSRQSLQKNVQNLLDKVDKQQMSTYQKKSELSLFNQSAVNEWYPVSAQLSEVIRLSLQLSRLSGGAFDVTVGPLVNLWGFGPQMQTEKVPGEQAIKDAYGRVGYDSLRVHKDESRLYKTKDIYVDLSAIAKGYAVDRVADYLERLKIKRFYVDIGGEFRVKGLSPDGDEWRAAIEMPQAVDKRKAHNILRLNSSGISGATSGDYRNYFEQQGVRYSHTIDPGTGRPITHKLASVTVLHKSAAWADGLATALNVMGPEKGLAFAKTQKIAAFFIIRQGNQFITRHSGLFQQYLSE